MRILKIKSLRHFAATAVAALVFSLSTSAVTAQQVNAVSVEGCDYVSADVNNGWGWNEAAQESCPPLATDNEANGLAPDLVGIVARPEGKYWLQLEVSSDGIIYSYDPSLSLLLATNANGYVLWQKQLDGRLFVADLKLNAAEDRLIATFLGGEIASFFLDGKRQWLLVNPDYPEINMELGNTAIIADLNFATSTGISRQVMSIGYDGKERWRFTPEERVASVFIGRDNLVYVRVNGEQEKVYVLRQ